MESEQNNSSTYQPPPQSVGIGVKILFGLSHGVLMVGRVHGDVILLHQVDKEGCQDEREETDVPGCDQLLQKHVKHDGCVDPTGRVQALCCKQ